MKCNIFPEVYTVLNDRGYHVVYRNGLNRIHDIHVDDIHAFGTVLDSYPLGKTSTDVERTPSFPVWKFSGRPYSWHPTLHQRCVRVGRTNYLLRTPGHKKTFAKLSYGSKVGSPLNVTSECIVWADALWDSLEVGIKHNAPDEGLEPATLRLKVWCSTDWANRALYMNVHIRLFYKDRCYRNIIVNIVFNIWIKYFFLSNILQISSLFCSQSYIFFF